MKTILFCDTESAGFINDRYPDEHPAQPPLVQLGALLVDADNGAEFATLEMIVKPNGYRIPDAAAKVHGVTTALAEAFGLPLSLIVPAYVQLRNQADALAFYNAKFDLAILRGAIARNGKPVTLPGPGKVIDVMIEAMPICAIPKREGSGSSKLADGPYKWPKLAEVYQYFFGTTFAGAHGALADARAAKEVWFEIKRRKEQGDSAPYKAAPGGYDDVI